MQVVSTSRSRPISSATVSKTSAGGGWCATSVATRRSAACSSASAPRARSDMVARRRARVARAPTMTDITRNMPSTNKVAPSRMRSGGRKYQSNARMLTIPTGSA